MEANDMANDMAKMREALAKVKEWMEHRIATRGFEFSATFPTMLEDVVLPALAAPPRNCDMGTVDEQAERFIEYCCGRCGGINCVQGLKMGDEIYKCAIKWMQMPYEARKANDKAMRRALEETQAVVKKCLETLNGIPDSCGYGGLIEDVADELCYLRDEHVNPALSAPARNCDVFGTESERQAAFIAYYNEAYGLGGSERAVDACDLKHDVDGILHDYIKWLFDAAEPKTKGDGDGR